MRISIVMLFDAGRQDYGNTTSAVAAEYAKRHGYTLRVHRFLIDQRRTPTWNKILAVSQALADADWVLWLDVDALIVNQAVKVEQLIEMYAGNKEIIFSEDEGGLCAGIFLVKNSAWSSQLLQTLLYLGNAKDEDHMNEQGAMVRLLRNFNSVAERTGLIPEEIIANPHTPFSPNVFIMHYWSNTLPWTAVFPYVDQIIKKGWRQEFYFRLSGERKDGKP